MKQACQRDADLRYRKGQFEPFIKKGRAHDYRISQLSPFCDDDNYGYVVLRNGLSGDGQVTTVTALFHQLDNI